MKWSLTLKSNWRIETCGRSTEVNRIQVKGRRFGYKAGSMILAFKEYGEREKKLSFAVPLPEWFDKVLWVEQRKQIRALILQKMGASTRRHSNG
jgi:hypothetical protein